MLIFYHSTNRGFHRRTSRKLSRGLSIVELLVGVAVGLFLLAGASQMLVASVTSSRSLLAEARVNQNLRAAADLITRDLRRAGFWENAMAGTRATMTASTQNPHATIAVSATNSSITYSLARDFAAGRTNVVDKDTVEADEKFGFRLANGTVQMQVGEWQAITDPSVLTVTALAITPFETAVDIRDSCFKQCCDSISGTCTATNVASPPGCPKLNLRRYDLVLSGQSTKDAEVTRTLRTSVRVRNDAPAGACPN